MSEIEDGRVPRLMVFPDRPDCLVLYLPKDTTVVLPPLASPLTKAGVAENCAQFGLDVRVSEGTPGKWGAAYSSLHKAEKNERRQRHLLAEAAKNAERRSGSSAATSRAEAIAEKNAIDEQVRALKGEIGKAKVVAFETGKYMPANIYRAKEQQLKDLKDKSQALQTRIGELRDAEKKERAAVDQAEHHTYAEEFLKAARCVLPETVLQQIHGLLRESGE